MCSRLESGATIAVTGASGYIASVLVKQARICVEMRTYVSLQPKCYSTALAWQQMTSTSVCTP